MGMVLMVAGMGGCSLFRFFRCWVMHPMAVMAMVMVHLGQCDLRGQCRDGGQSKSDPTHGKNNHVAIVESPVSGESTLRA